MEVSFGVLALWIYASRYTKFPISVPHPSIAERGTVERDYVRLLGQDILRGYAVKYMLTRNWNLYGLPRYLSGELDLDIFNDPDRLGSVDSQVESTLKGLAGIILTDAQTFVYPCPSDSSKEFRVDVTSEYLSTIHEDWGNIRSTEKGFQYRFVNLENYSREDIIQILGVVRTHLFICAYIEGLQGRKPAIVPVLHHVRGLLQKKDTSHCSGSILWEV
jgi:hypothetical protein